MLSRRDKCYAMRSSRVWSRDEIVNRCDRLRRARVNRNQLTVEATSELARCAKEAFRHRNTTSIVRFVKPTGYKLFGCHFLSWRATPRSGREHETPRTNLHRGIFRIAHCMPVQCFFPSTLDLVSVRPHRYRAGKVFTEKKNTSAPI